MPHIINFVHASPPQPSTAVHAYEDRDLGFNSQQLLTFHVHTKVYPVCVCMCAVPSARAGHNIQDSFLTGTSQTGTSQHPVPSQMVSELHHT